MFPIIGILIRNKTWILTQQGKAKIYVRCNDWILSKLKEGINGWILPNARTLQKAIHPISLLYDSSARKSAHTRSISPEILAFL